MSKSPLRNFIAIVLIGVGTLLVLANFDIIDADVNQLWHYLYPLFFIVFGMTWIVGYFKKGGSGWIFGSFFLIFGTLLLLGQMTSFDYTFSDIFKLWPLLIVYIGFSLIGLGKNRNRPRIHVYTNGEKKRVNWHGFSIGDHEYKEPNWKVEPIDLRNAAGSYYFDFTKAFIPEEEIPIIVTSWAGDVQMIMPENLEFRIDASVKAGEINVLGNIVDGVNRTMEYETENYDEAVKKLDIFLDLKAGSIRIDKV